jgi:hypothetical protein
MTGEKKMFGGFIDFQSTVIILSTPPLEGCRNADLMAGDQQQKRFLFVSARRSVRRSVKR